jgi:hypothetical protein
MCGFEDIWKIEHEKSRGSAMNDYQLGVALSTIAVVGLVLFVSVRPPRTSSQPGWMLVLAIPLAIALYASSLLAAILYGIARVGRLSGHEALIRKWIDTAMVPVLLWVCIVLAYASGVGALVWVVVRLVRGS